MTQTENERNLGIDLIQNKTNLIPENVFRLQNLLADIEEKRIAVEYGKERKTNKNAVR